MPRLRHGHPPRRRARLRQLLLPPRASPPRARSAGGGASRGEAVDLLPRPAARVPRGRRDRGRRGGVRPPAVPRPAPRAGRGRGRPRGHGGGLRLQRRLRQLQHLRPLLERRARADRARLVPRRGCRRGVAAAGRGAAARPRLGEPADRELPRAVARPGPRGLALRGVPPAAARVLARELPRLPPDAHRARVPGLPVAVARAERGGTGAGSRRLSRARADHRSPSASRAPRTSSSSGSSCGRDPRSG